MYRDKKVAVVIPAYNEALSIGKVVSGLFSQTEAEQPIVDYLIVCDNASTDTTAAIAKSHGATVVHEPKMGYGRACLRALQCTKDADVVVFVDGDHSVVPQELTLLLDAWLMGADLVIGSRTLGDRQPGALTPHQIWGNRFATLITTLWWQQSVTDLGPFRAIDSKALAELDMQDPTFGWTMEMQAKALAMGQRVVEVPVSTRVRIGKSKVSGTLRGSIGAMFGILGMLAKIAWQHRDSQQKQAANA